ncbi:unnamed protein product [Cylicocyclus nassatus]|uniref:Uncharacterized protein n=1 Tax=Cylicocyclus nassatus TaxID=53992 RepID=A0AA36H5N4_CYLNA|nr:unnamed protein product [Cylicocyclus nassatus]
MLAKLLRARHKPRQQTVIPFEFVPVLFEETRIGDNRMLGGKLGNSIQQKLGVGTMADLAAVPYDPIEWHFGDQAHWIIGLAKGLDDTYKLTLAMNMEAPTTSTATGSASNSPNSSPYKKKNKKEGEPEVKVDENGCEVYNPTKFESTEDSNHAPAVPAVELSDIRVISPSVYEELSSNIKAR